MNCVLLKYELLVCLSVEYQVTTRTKYEGGEDKADNNNKKRWEDNIREWTGLEFAKSQRAVEDRKKWRRLVVNHLWCPNDPRG